MRLKMICSKAAVIEKTNLSWCFSANHFPGECTSNKCLSNKLMNAWVILLFNFFFIYLSYVSTYSTSTGFTTSKTTLFCTANY